MKTLAPADTDRVSRSSNPPLRTVDLTSMHGHLGSWSHGPGPLYLKLHVALCQAIERGDIAPGSRLPPERLLAADLAVSRGTVMAAYRLLRDDGWADSRQGSGTWTRRDAGRASTALNDAVAVRARRLTAGLLESTPGLVDLTISGSADLTDLPADLFEVTTAQVTAAVSHAHGYEPLGVRGLRERIAEYYRRRGLPTDTDQIVVTTGAQQAITLTAGLLVRPGEAVVVESPTFPGAVDAFSRVGARLVTVPPAHEWTSIEVLRRAVVSNAARLVYLMPAGQNPTGRVMPTGLRHAVELLAETEQVYVASDDTLADVHFDRSSPTRVGLTGAPASSRLLSFGSLGKTVWGGLRIGWLRAPADFADRAVRLKNAADLGSSVHSQVVACRALDSLDALARARAASLAGQAALLQRELRLAVPDWTWEEPLGGPSLWVRLPHGDGDTFAQAALRRGVAILPGSVLAADGTQLDRVRIAYARPAETLLEGVGRLARAWSDYCSRPPAAAAAPGPPAGLPGQLRRRASVREAVASRPFTAASP